MDITRRKFLRFAPAAVGAIALGVVALLTASPAKRKATTAFIWHKSAFGLGHLEGETVTVISDGRGKMGELSFE